MNVIDGVPCLYTADGRVFNLLMSSSEVKKFAGKSVDVQGKVGKSDDIENIKVKKIKEIPPEKVVVEEVEHEDYQRAARIIKESESRKTVSNIRWNITKDPASKETKALHSWEDATIDVEKVVKAYYLVKPFAPKFIAAHTLLAFSFEDGGVISKTGQESSNIVLTIEAFKKIGQTYGLVKTMKKEFDIVWILTTLQNYADLNVNYNSSSDCEIIVYPINFTREQTKALLLETIKQACVNRQGEYYHTIRNNCTNNLVILMNHVLPTEKKVKLWTIPSMIYNLKATMPLSVVKMLKKKEIIGEPVSTINRENFSESIKILDK